MRSEPPTGDDLTRLLVTMKRNVLERAAKEPASAKRKSLRHILGLGIGVTALLGLGTGAAIALMANQPENTAAPATDGATARPPVTSTAAPPPTTTPPEPPPTDYVVTPGQPASRYGLDCGTLVDPASVSGLFATEVAAIDPILSESGVDIAIPRRAAILAVGGSVCEWSNGVPMNEQYGLEPGYTGLTISVVPRGAAGWSQFATQHGMPTDERQCDGTMCWASAAVGDAWVTASAFAAGGVAGDESDWSAVVDQAVAAVGAAGPAAPSTITERMTWPTVEDCDAVLPTDAVRSITATPGAQVMIGAGGWSEWAEARLYADAWGCGWGIDDMTQAARVDTLPEGRWAYLRMLDAGTSTSIDIAGLAEGDLASVRCDARFGTTCAVDLAVGLDWFNVSANDEATAIALAEALLGRLSG